MMRGAARIGEIGFSLALAVVVHAAVFLGYATGDGRQAGGGPAGQAGAMALSGSDSQIEALLKAWETPPELTEPGEISPRAVAEPDLEVADPPADTELALLTPDKVSAPNSSPDRPRPPEMITAPRIPELRALPAPVAPAPTANDLSPDGAIPAAEPSEPRRQQTLTALSTAAPLSGAARRMPSSDAFRETEVHSPETAPPPKSRPARTVRRTARRPVQTLQAERPDAPETPEASAAPARAGTGTDGAEPAPTPGAGGRGAGTDPALLAGLQRSFGSAVRAAIARQKRYPRRARQRGEEGVARLAITLDRGGRLLGSRIVSSSGSPSLDAAALDAARSVPRFPSPPADLSGERFSFVVPIAFRVTR